MAVLAGLQHPPKEANLRGNPPAKHHPLIERVFDWAIPAGLDETSSSRGRLLVLFVLVVVPSVLTFFAYYLASGFMLSALGTAFGASVIGSSLIAMRRFGVTAGAHTFLAGGCFGLALILLAHGGIESPATAWLALGPWAAMMLGGRRFGLLWIGIILAVVLGIGLLDLIALMPPSEVPGGDTHLLALLAMAGLLTLASMMAASYDTQRSAAFDALIDARDEARAQARELELARDRIEADAKEQRRLELELRSAQKLEAVGRLAAGVAHEINSPLQYVSDSLFFMAEAERDLVQLVERYRAGQDLKALAEEIDLPFLLEALPQAQARAREGLGRITRIISAMRELARPEGDTPERLDLNHLTRTALALGEFELSQVAELETSFAPDLPWILARPAALGQAILAVLVNAAHAIADAGPRRGKVTVTTRRDGDHVVLSVEDTGTGIREEIRDRIFDPFFTTKDVGRGSGQGLALARHIVVEQSRGRLEFETELGRGTTFFLRLPIEEAAG